MRRLLFLVLGVLFASVQLLAQRTITGTISDSTGLGIPNASVKVSGSPSGTTTDARGTFSLSVPQGARSLEITSVGYLPSVIGIPASGNINLSLRPDPKSLTEVVVTGIVNIRRDRFAGAASKIDQRDIANRPIGSFDQALQGRVPGITALTSSGAPGTSATVIIRGSNSIIGGTSPFYVVDGIPVEAGVFQGINSNDIESIDVLRDASTTALYGSRAAGGVIAVTTKRGKSGKMRLSYDGQFGVKQRPQFTWDMMNSAQLLQAQEDYGKIVGTTNTTDSILVPGFYYSPSYPGYSALSAGTKARYASMLDSLRGINNNWRDVFFRDGNFSNHQISLSGGTGATRLYTSLALYNEQGTTIRTDMKRATWRGNVDYKDDRLTLQVSSTVGYTKRNFQQSTTTNNLGNPFLIASIAAPYATPYLPNGAYNVGTPARYAGANTLQLTNLDANYSDQLKTTLGTTASYKITNDLSAGVTAGVDFRETQSSNYGSKLAFSRQTSTTPTGQAGFQSESLTRNVYLDVRPNLTYRKLIGSKNDLDVSVYGEFVKNAYKSTNGTGYGIDPRTPNTPAAITQGNGTNQLYAVVGGSKGQNVLVSGLALARYTYDNKYTITASYRQDGSSKLPTDTRWQDFYSVGLVWDALKESFLANNRVANTLRLRASYGGAGNSDNFPSDYLYQSQYGAGSTVSGLNGQSVSYPGYNQVRWETTWTANVGVDFGFLQNRIYGKVDVYDRETKDVFVEKALSGPGSYVGGGQNSLNTNAGQIRNRGIEFEGNVEVVRSKNLLWTVYGNFALNRNKVVNLGGESSFEQGTELITVGLPLGSHYEVKWGGVDAATGQPLYYDLNGNLTTVYNSSNAVQEFGTWEAPWKGGFGTRLNFKNFEVSTLFSWQRGGSKVDNLEYFMENPVGFLGAGYNQANTLNFWRKPGDVATTPSPLYSVNFSSKIIHNADFLRWKDLVVAYTLPSSITNKTRVLSNVRIYVQGTNLLMWTKWRGMDPEAGATNINLSEFPNPRAYTAGITIGF